MGLVLNPVAFRLGHFTTWEDAWFKHHMYYPAFLHSVLLIKTLIFFIFFDFLFLRKFDFFVYSHISLYLRFNKIYIGLYLYDSTDRTSFYDQLKRLRHAGWWKLRLKSKWMKKKVLLSNNGSRKFPVNMLILFKLFNIHLDKLVYENLSRKYAWRRRRKLLFLKKKYGKSFIAREEIVMLKKFFGLLKKKRLKFSISRIAKYYLKWYFNSPSALFRDLIKAKSKKLDVWLNLKYNYTFFFYILSIFEMFLQKHNKKHFARDHVSRKVRWSLLKFYNIWFRLRPLYYWLGKFVEMLVMKLGHKSYCKMFILSNAAVSAEFIARYVAVAFYNRFSFRDLIRPIRRNLKRLLYVRVRKNRIRSALKFSNIRKIRALKRKMINVSSSLLSYLNLIFIKFIANLKELKYKFNFLHFNKVYFKTGSQKIYFFLKVFNYLKSFILQLSNYYYFNYDKVYFLKKKFKINYVSLLIVWKKCLKLNFIKKFNFNLKYNLSFFFFTFKKYTFTKFFKKEKVIDFLKLTDIFVKFKNGLQYFSFIKRIFEKLYWKIDEEMLNKNFYNYLSFRNRKKFLKNKRVIKWSTFSLFWKKLNRRKVVLNREYFLSYFKPYKAKIDFKRKHKTKHYFKKKLLMNRFFNGNLKKSDFLYRFYYRAHSVFLKKRMYYLSGIKKYKKIKTIKKKRKLAVDFKKLNLQKLINKFKLVTRERLNKFNVNIFFFMFFCRSRQKFLMPFYKSFLYRVDEVLRHFKQRKSNKAHYLDLLHLAKQNYRLFRKKRDILPLRYKYTMRTFLDSGRAVLYGYKFHFKGRFKRKQKAASIWFVRGSMPVSEMCSDVERSFFTYSSPYGKCTVRVWFYKGFLAPKYLVSY